MNKENDLDTTRREGAENRIFHWFDQRTGVKHLAKKVLDEHIPGGARFAYVFGSGLLFIFLLQAVTGVCLALYYTPTAETAHTSVAYITKQVEGGAFLRSLHSYGSSAMIIVLALHFLQTFLYGSFKGRRELLWLSGALLSFLVLGMGFTGYLLPWDQKAYFATAVGTNVIGQVPVIGAMLTRLVRGGGTIGTLTVSRFYVAHVFLIPAMILTFIGAHILLFRKAGPAGPVKEHPINPRLSPEHFYPRQVVMDMAFALLIMAILSGLSYFRPATLGPVANPADTSFLPRPEWYYLPLFEWLKFWEGPNALIGVIVLPSLLALVFFLMPFLDRKLERSPWRRPIPVLAVAFVFLGMVYLGVRSRLDDRNNPDIANQLHIQDEQEKAYSATPFEPYLESPGGASAEPAAAGPVSVVVAEGKGVFTNRGCVGCHGATGMGTAAAPSLVGVTHKFSEPDLIALLHNPSAKMRAGRMPAVDAPPAEMSALVDYLGVLGTSAANVAPILTLPSDQPTAGLKRTGSNGREKRETSPKLSAAAIAGRQVFQTRACFACHGPDGSGGRAPAVATLIAGLPDAQLVQILQNPNQQMRKGGMPPVAASHDEIGSLIAYLRTLSKQQPANQAALQPDAPAKSHEQESAATVNDSSSSTPPPPGSNKIDSVVASGQGAVATGDDHSSSGRKLFLAGGCIACHGMNAQGTRIAPSLIGISDRFPGDKLLELLRHPTNKMRDGGMPTVNLDESQMSDLLAYLSSLKSLSSPPSSSQLNPALRAAPTQSQQAVTDVSRPMAAPHVD